jgi:hypothetical protein
MVRISKGLYVIACLFLAGFLLLAFVSGMSTAWPR